VRQIHFIIRAALDRAVRWQYIAVNPAALAVPPSFKKPRPDPPSAEEIAAVLNDAWKDPAWGLLLWLVMVTGCRRGEICALRWTDLNLDRGTIKIERSSQQTADGIREKGTKSGQERHIALDPYTVDLLRTHLATNREQCEQVGIELGRSAFVFSGSPDFSTPLVPSSVSQRYRRLAVRNQLRSTRIHALRHYSATELLSAGVDIRTVAGRLGHGSGGATTLRYYAAWVANADHRAASSIADTLPRPDPSRRQPRSPYEKLAAELRTAIETGAYPTGSLLPTTAEIAGEHNVSVGTVNRAVALLKSQGLVTARRGERATVIAGFAAMS
jgi:integrase